MLAAIITGAIITLLVLILSFVTISKGYGYQHTVDPPVSSEEEQKESEHPHQ